MKMNTKLAALALSAALLLSLTACGGSAVKGESPFKNMETVDLDGNALDSAVFADKKLTMVNAWNLGCTPCIEELPVLEQLDRDLADRGFAVLGLYYTFGAELTEKERGEIADVLSNAGAGYTQFLASGDMMKTDELKVMAAFPATWFVDGEGNIVDKVEGSNDYEGWKSVIETMLEKVEDNA